MSVQAKQKTRILVDLAERSYLNVMNDVYNSIKPEGSSNKALIWREPEVVNHNNIGVQQLTLDMVPKALRKYIRLKAEQMDNASEEFIAASLLATIAGLVGTSVAIAPKKKCKSWKVNPILWCMLIGDPSTKKSPCCKVGVSLLDWVVEHVINPLNDERKAAFKVDYQIAERSNTVLQSKITDLIEQGDTGREDILAAKREEAAVKEAVVRNPVINDSTVEALAKRLSTNPKGIILFRDELNGWLSVIERSDRAHERAFYLEAFNGSGKYSQDRIGRGEIQINDAAVSILGGIQPGMLGNVLMGREKNTANDGLFERFQLALYPEKNENTYTDIESDEVLETNMRNLYSCIATLGEVEEKIVFNFDSKAQVHWTKWAKDQSKIEFLASPDDQAVLGKYPALVAKLTLIFCIIDQANKCDDPKRFTLQSIADCKSLKRAIKWASFLYSHNIKIRSLTVAECIADKAKAIVPKLTLLNGQFIPRDLYRKGWSGVSTASAAFEVINLLIEWGYIRKQTGNSNLKKEAEVYVIHPDHT